MHSALCIVDCVLWGMLYVQWPGVTIGTKIRPASTQEPMWCVVINVNVLFFVRRVCLYGSVAKWYMLVS